MPAVPEALSIPSPAPGRSIWLRVGTLLDGCRDAPIRHAHVVYNRDVIRFVGDAAHTPPRALLAAGQDQPDLDLPTYTLLPGLIEAHAHLFLEGGELDVGARKAYLKQSPEALLDAAGTRLERLVRMGVIAVRDAGDKHGVGLALSRRYETPDRPLMPYVDSPGAAIHRRGRYGGFMAEPIEDHASLRDCVAARVRAGADRIKLIPTGIIDFQEGRVRKEPQLNTEAVAELVRAAHAFGRQTFAHASGDDGIEHAVEGGVDSVEHGFFIREDQLARMRDRHIAWVPTFAPVQEQVDHAAQMAWDEQVVSNLQRMLDQHAASLVKAHAMGVPVIAGSDAGSMGVAHGLGLLYELALMEAAGLPPLAVIQAATGTSAKRLGYKEDFGQIKPGFRSRFILTPHNPLASVTHLQKDKYVVYDGAVYFDPGEPDAAGL